MSQLIVPMSAAELRAKREQMFKRTAEFQYVEYLKDVERQLKDLSENLSLVLVDNEEAAVALGAKAGYWNVEYQPKDGSMDTVYFPVQNKDGSRAEPGQWLVEQFRRDDMRRPQRIKELARQQKKREEDLRKAEELSDEEAIEELYLRVKAKVNPSFNFGTKGWKASLGKD